MLTIRMKDGTTHIEYGYFDEVYRIAYRYDISKIDSIERTPIDKKPIQYEYVGSFIDMRLGYGILNMLVSAYLGVLSC